MHKSWLHTSVLLLGVSLTAHAYDPMRTLRSGTMVSGQAYSQFDPLTTHAGIATPEVEKPIKERRIGVEVGSRVNLFLRYKASVGGVKNKIENLIDEANDNQASLREAIRFRREIQSNLAVLSRQGQLADGLYISGLLPAISWTDPYLGGSITFDYQDNASSTVFPIFPAAFGLSVTNGSVGLNTSCGIPDTNGDGVIDENEINNYVVTNPSQNNPTGFSSGCRLVSSGRLVAHAATSFESVSLGYSRQVYRHRNPNPWKAGKMVVGVRANYAQATFESRSINIDTDQNNKNVDDLISDYLFKKDDKNARDSQWVDFDLGVSWVSTRYVAGATLGNIFTPSVRYPSGKEIDLGMPLALHGTWFMHPESKRWGVRFHNDLTGQKSLTGADQQWRTLSVGYASESWYIPGFELGKRWSLAKDRTSYTSVGLKLFKVMKAQIGVSDQRSNGHPTSFYTSVNTSVQF